MPQHPSNVRVWDVAQFMAMKKQMDSIAQGITDMNETFSKIEEDLHIIAKSLAKLTKTQVIVNGPAQQE